MGIVRAYQKGTLKGEATPEVQGAASSMKEKDVKKFASTKHKGLPEKKVTKESFNDCLLYTSPSPRDRSVSRMPSSA